MLKKWGRTWDCAEERFGKHRPIGKRSDAVAVAR